MLYSDAALVCVCSSVKGYIILVKPYWCPFEAKVLECVRVGCAGIVERSDEWLVAGITMWSSFEGGHSRSSLRAPMVQVVGSDGDIMERLLDQYAMPNTAVVVTINSGDYNAWENMYKTALWIIVWRVMFTGISLGIFVLASYRLWKWLQINPQKRSSLAMTCLAIEAIANLERGIVLAIDPLLSRRIIPSLPALMLMTISAPLGFATTIMIAVYWAGTCCECFGLCFVYMSLIYNTRIPRMRESAYAL